MYSQVFNVLEIFCRETDAVHGEHASHARNIYIVTIPENVYMPDSWSVMCHRMILCTRSECCTCFTVSRNAKPMELSRSFSSMILVKGKLVSSRVACSGLGLEELAAKALARQCSL